MLNKLEELMKGMLVRIINDDQNYDAMDLSPDNAAVRSLALAPLPEPLLYAYLTAGFELDELDACTPDHYKSMIKLFRDFSLSQTQAPIFTPADHPQTYPTGDTPSDLFNLLNGMRNHPWSFVAQLSNRSASQPTEDYVLEKQRELFSKIAVLLDEKRKEKLTEQSAATVAAMPAEIHEEASGLSEVWKAVISNRLNVEARLLRDGPSHDLTKPQTLEVIMGLDVTSSMYPHLAATKQTMKQMVDQLGTNVSCRLCIVGDYSDDQERSKGNPLYFENANNKACKFFPPTTSGSKMHEQINGVELVDGGDEPEAIELMLSHAAKIKCDADQRIIILIGDAAPHGYIDERFDLHPGLPCPGGNVFTDKKVAVGVAKPVKRLMEEKVAVYTIVCGDLLDARDDDHREAIGAARKFGFAISRLTKGCCTLLTGESSEQASQLCGLITTKLRIEKRAGDLKKLVTAKLQEVDKVPTDVIHSREALLLIKEFVENDPVMQGLLEENQQFQAVQMTCAPGYGDFLGNFNGGEKELRQFVRFGLINNSVQSQLDLHVGMGDEEPVFRSLRGELSDAGGDDAPRSLAATSTLFPRSPRKPAASPEKAARGGIDFGRFCDL